MGKAGYQPVHFDVVEVRRARSSRGSSMRSAGQGKDGIIRIRFGKSSKQALARAYRRRPAQLVASRGAVEWRNGRERPDLIARERHVAMKHSVEKFHAQRGCVERQLGHV